MPETRGKRGFSVELKSNEYVKSLNLSREGRESVLVEEVLERAQLRKMLSKKKEAE